jgi:hypothetical protein
MSGSGRTSLRRPCARSGASTDPGGANLILRTGCALLLLLPYPAGTARAIGKKAANPVAIEASRSRSRPGRPAAACGQAAAVTPLLLEFMRSRKPSLDAGELRSALTAADASRGFKRYAGKDVIDLGQDMFVYFEDQAASSVIDPDRAWKLITSEHFVFVTRQDGPADRDRAMLVEAAEQTYEEVPALFGLETEVERSRSLLSPRLPSGEVQGRGRADGKLVVLLHQRRLSGPGWRIGGRSMGATSIGATLAPDGQGRRRGRLAVRIDVLYFNALSLPVVRHEIGHALLLLGSFKPDPLRTCHPRNEAELKRAFFDGYRRVPTFLHEGVADYVVFYLGLYRRLGLMPEPEQLVLELLEQNRYIPLATLMKKGTRYRTDHRRAYTLETSAFLHHLLQTHGREKVKDWLLADDRRGRRSFMQTFRCSIEVEEQRWHHLLQQGAADGRDQAEGLSAAPKDCRAR